MAMSQLVSDSFTRVSYPVGLSASGNWTVFPYVNTSTVDATIPSAGLCETGSTTNYTSDYYSGVSWAGDHYSEVTLKTDVNGYGIYVHVRVQNNAGTWSGYTVLINDAGGGNGVIIVRYYTNYATNTFAQIGSTVTGLTFSVGDVVRLTAQGTTITVTQNGSSIFSQTDSHIAAGGAPGLGFVYANPMTNEQITKWAGGENAYSISGSAGVAGATVSYSGAASGSVTADGSGNYTISGLFPGAYTITPTLAGYKFSPTNQVETITSSNITGVNFTASKAATGGVITADMSTKYQARIFTSRAARSISGPRKTEVRTKPS